MKLLSYRCRETGTLLLVVAVFTVFAVVLGVVTYNIIKACRRVDGIMDRRFIDENLTNSLLSLPPGALPSSIQITTERVWFESRDIPRDPPALQGFGPESASSGAAWHVEVLLESSGEIRLAVRNMAASGWVSTALGSIVTLDEYGFPTPLPYNSGPPLTGIAVFLQSKTNLTASTWENVIVLTLQTNAASYHKIDLNRPQQYYRVIQP